MSRFARRCAGGGRDEAAAAGLAPDQPVGGQALHGVPGGHPADAELGAQVGIGRQLGARRQHRDAFAQRLLDLAVLRLVADLGQSGHRLTSRCRAYGPRPRLLRTVDRRPDRAGPRPELGGHDLDAVERGREPVAADLVADRVEQQVGRGRHSAAEDDSLRRDHVTMLAIPTPRHRPTSRARSRARGRRRALARSPLRPCGPAGLGDAIGPREGLETASVAAPARAARRGRASGGRAHRLCRHGPGRCDRRTR